MAKKDEAQAEAPRANSGIETVTARTPETGREVSADFNFGKDLEESRTLFGDEVFHSQGVAQVRIGVQSLMRRHMVDTYDKEGKKIADAKTDAEIQEMVASHKPGIAARTRKTPKDKLMSMLEGLSPEAQRELIKEAAQELGA